jgi:ribosomal protein L35AE/L33A
MEGKIISFRRGLHRQAKNQMVIQVEGIITKEKAKNLVNKKVAWKSQTGKEITGVVTRVMGGNGAIVATFERGLPGQSLNNKIKIEG